MDDKDAKRTTQRSVDSADTRSPTGPVSVMDTLSPRPESGTGGLPAVSVQMAGRYEIRREQGRGGMGRVLVAFDQHVGREVALKELLAQPDGSEDFQAEATRFLREARLAGNLEHPNIVPVHEVGASPSGALYYTMRLVRGKTLAQALEEAGSLGARLKRLGSFWDLSNAIAFAHSRGVLHRDLKPQNAMVGEFGETVLLDWGLAKVVGQKDERADDMRRGLEVLQAATGGDTAAGAIVGTPSYMSPEQADGRIDEIDERSDVWGLGAVLYEILTGRPPFEGKNHAATLVAVMEAPLTPVRVLCPDAPRDLAAIAEKALRKDKALRYQTAKELAADVDAYMTGGRVRAYRYSSWELLQRFGAENKAAVVSAAVVLAVIVGALIAVSLSLGREKVARAAATHESALALYRLAQARLQAAEQAREDSRNVVAAGLAAESLASNPANPRSRSFDRQFAREHPDARGLLVRAASVIYQAKRQSYAALTASIATDEVLTEVAYSPDGTRLAVGSYDGKVRVWDVEKRERVLELSGHKDRVYSLAYSPDGRILATGSRDRWVLLWDARTGAPLSALEGHQGLVRQVAFSPDGATLASASWDGTVRLWQVATGRTLKVLRHGDRALAVAFSPDGTLLATGGLDCQVHVWRLPSLEKILTIASHATDAVALAFAPDGRSLAIGGSEHAIHVFDPETGKSVQVLEMMHGGRGIWTLAYSRDGSWLAAGGFDKMVRLWDARSGSPLATLEAHDGTVAGVAFSPRADQLATAGQDRLLKLWSLRRGDALELGGHAGAVRGLAYAPGGKRLASGGTDKTIRVWDLATGRSLLTLAGHGSAVARLAFDGGGTRLASAARERLVIVWDLEQGRVLHRLEMTQATYDVAFSPDGTLLATAGADGVVRLFDPRTGALRTTLLGHEAPLTAVAFAPDGKQLASGGQDRTIRLWDLATGRTTKVLGGHTDWVWSLRYGPDGTKLLSAGKDGAVISWDVRTGVESRRFVGHKQWVNQARFSPDARYVVTGSDDQTARVWEVASGEQKLILHTTDEVAGVDFSPEGGTVAVPDGTSVRLYPLDFTLLDADPQQLLEEAKVGGYRGVE